MKLHHVAIVRSAVPVRWTAVRYPLFKREIGVAKPLRENEPASRDDSQAIPANTPPTQPYWLREEGASGIFHVDDKRLIGRPENPPDFPIEFVFEVGGQTLVLVDEPVSTADGGKPRNLAVVAPVALRFGSTVALFKPGASKNIEVEIKCERAAAEGFRQFPTIESLHTPTLSPLAS
jgi:hypothetical protein